MRNSNTKNFLNGKGFYIIMGICMLAIGITAWAVIATSGSSASKNIVENSKINNSSNLTLNSKTESETKNENKAVAGDVSGIKAESKSDSSGNSENSNSSAQTKTKKAAATYFTLPLTGEILKQYSDTELLYSKTYGDLRIHNGLDIKADAGTAVKASGDGTVTKIYKDAVLGNVIEIDHGNNITAFYCGLTDKAAVKAGDTVRAGTNIGAVGTIPCECSDESHLHLSFKQNGKYIAPLSLINLGA